jgi:hypothetical protein
VEGFIYNARPGHAEHGLTRAGRPTDPIGQLIAAFMKW